MKYSVYLKDELIDFVNQIFDDDLSDLWYGNHNSSEDFWKDVAKKYGFKSVSAPQSWREFCMSHINNQFEEIIVKVNNKKTHTLYISPNMTYQQTIDHALGQSGLSDDKYKDNPNFVIKLHVDGLFHGKGKTKSFISLITEFKEKKETVEKEVLQDAVKVELLKREAPTSLDWKKHFVDDFGHLDLLEKDENNDLILPNYVNDWADFYEMVNISQTPKNSLELGAMVDAISRKGDDDIEHYGYITSLTRNNKNRPVQLELKTFNGIKENWIWNGSLSKGGWIQKYEYDNLGSNQNVKNLKYKNLKVNDQIYDMSI